MNPFRDLDAMCAASLGDVYQVERTGDLLTLDIDEVFNDSDYGGASAVEFSHTVELLMADRDKVVVGDQLVGEGQSFKVLRKDLGPRGSRILDLRELAT